jgi:hypothetical protein
MQAKKFGINHKFGKYWIADSLWDRPKKSRPGLDSGRLGITRLGYRDDYSSAPTASFTLLLRI